jgi:hypothetical protein
MRTATEILAQFGIADLMRYVVRLESHGGDDTHLHGWCDLAVLDVLRQDPRFAEGPWHLLHADVGDPKTEFRAHPGEIGHGSLQIVINTHSGYFYADIDRFSPYTDVVNIGGHAFGEVVPNWIKTIGRLFRKKPKADHG